MQRFQPLTDVCFPLKLGGIFLPGLFFSFTATQLRPLERRSKKSAVAVKVFTHAERMGCPQWKTVKLKVVSLHPGNSDRAWLFESNSRPPAAEQLLQRIGQLNLDRSPDPSGLLIPNGRLGTLFQSVIL
ncbi:uncharacterized protein LOC128301363 [Anopheles moucheti]|uniref:uncharacterized protein LOC128301363 n=1 Tax=Anopheles moucheti TaxID=186751 RepID=UPI0022F1226B|nr:uncharacterized protein LOC128301363 [Anopheles moucheti]